MTYVKPLDIPIGFAGPARDGSFPDVREHARRIAESIIDVFMSIGNDPEPRGSDGGATEVAKDFFDRTVEPVAGNSTEEDRSGASSN